MLEQIVKNIGFVRAQGWASLCLFALSLCLGCTRVDEIEFDDPSGRLSIQTVNVASTSDWASKSANRSVHSTLFVKLGDSLLLYARVEPLGGDTTMAITRGTPILNVNELSDIRMNLYNGVTNNWTNAMPTTEAFKISRSGKVYVTTPSYNWSSKTDKITLLAYTPLPLAANGLTEGVNGNTVAYVVPTDITKQPDFCASLPDIDRSVDVVNNDGVKHMRSITLYHQFTAVGFALNGWNAKVSKIEVSGVAFMGTYALRTGVWVVAAVGSDSRLLGVNTSKVPVDYYNDNTVWTDITRSNGYLMMVPQTLTDKAMVKITYTDVAGNEQAMTALLAEMSSGKWVAGYKITYCIQLETAPSIGTDPISLYMPWKKGYTTTTPITFVTKDPQDRYTFKWGESWNIIHRGPAKENNIAGGAGSGWYTSTTNQTPIWFFTKDDNLSITSSRSSVVTLDAWRTVDRTFTVVQGMKPYITVEGMPSISNVIPTAGGKYTVTVKSNYSWEATLSNITASATSGAANMSGQRIEITIPPGDGNEGAINAIFKTTNDNKVPDLVAMASYVYTREVNLKIDPTSAGEIILAVGQEYPITITAGSSISWTAVTSSGIKLNKQQGTGNSSMKITIESNPSLTARRNVKVDFKIGSKIVATWSGVQEALKEFHFDGHNGWAGSNIYWDGSKLTFDDYGVKTHEQYIGVYFSWGGLVAVSPGEKWSQKTILFATGDKNWKGEPWDPKTCKSMYDIPIIEVGNFSQNSILTRHHVLELHSPNRNIGDICKYMSDNGLSPVTAGNRGWRMPTVAEYISQGLAKGQATKEGEFNQVSGDLNGIVKISSGFRSALPHKGAFFPASGRMDISEPMMQGTRGKYWSGTAETSYIVMGYDFAAELNSYYLPERFYLSNAPGHPVRCVRNK